MAHKYLIFFIGLLITHKDEHFVKKKNAFKLDEK